MHTTPCLIVLALVAPAICGNAAGQSKKGGAKGKTSKADLVAALKESSAGYDAIFDGT